MLTDTKTNKLTILIFVLELHQIRAELLFTTQDRVLYASVTVHVNMLIGGAAIGDHDSASATLRSQPWKRRVMDCLRS